MFYGFTSFIWNRLPYFRYADTDNSRAKAGATEETGIGESGQGGEAGGEERGGGCAKIKIGEECDLKGVESVDTYSSPTPTSPRTGTYLTTSSATSSRSGSILSYNERTGSCVVQDSHGNIIVVATAGNPFKR